MIITVTLNPAIDKTVKIERLVHGGLNRIQNINVDAGGKGINVSKTIRALGGESIAMGFLGGTNGTIIQNKLRELGIQQEFSWIAGETRINTKIVEEDGCVTELNESGPSISENELHQFVQKIEEKLSAGDFLVLSGSVPTGVPKDIYKTLTLVAHEKGAKVFADADGELFQKTIEAKPDIIKPNQDELERYAGRNLEKEEVVRVGKEFLEKGIQTVIISMGADGAYFLTKEHTLYSPGLNVSICSTVGAGDAMVAAFSYGMQNGQSLTDCAMLAMATSAGAITTVGTNPPTLEDVKILLKKVVLT